MTEDRVQLARTLKTRARLARVLAVIVPIAVVAGLVVVPWSIERIEFQQAKSDFAETWCATYGTDPTDIGADKWLAYVAANQDFLEENFHTLGIKAAEAFAEDRWLVGVGLQTGEPEEFLMLEYAVERYGGGYVEYYWFSEWFRTHFSFFGFPGGGAPRCV